MNAELAHDVFRAVVSSVPRKKNWTPPEPFRIDRPGSRKKAEPMRFRDQLALAMRGG